MLCLESTVAHFLLALANALTCRNRIYIGIQKSEINVMPDKGRKFNRRISRCDMGRTAKGIYSIRCREQPPDRYSDKQYLENVLK